MLSSAQKAAFAKDGYLVIEDFLDQKSVLDPVRAEYAGILDELYAGWFEAGLVDQDPARLDFFGKLLTAYRAGCDWFQPMDISLPASRIQPDTPFHFGPAVFGLLTCPRLLDLVESLIGPEITSNPIQHVRIKPPVMDLRAGEIRAHIRHTDWHQDSAVAHADADHTDMVTVWCAVTDATVENGCLTVIPGGHRDGMLPHCPQIQTSIAQPFRQPEKATPVPVKSGAVLLLHPLLPHASLANHSDGFRWSFDIRYNRTGQPTGRSHFPEFIARSRANPETELTSWQGWRDLWIDARARLATRPHIPIHRWQEDAEPCA